jgi:hypothetical protein
MGKEFISFHGNMQRDLTAPFVDDGLIEVVGFRDAWHGLVLLAPNGHGTRLAQVMHLFSTHFLNSLHFS